MPRAYRFGYESIKKRFTHDLHNAGIETVKYLADTIGCSIDDII